MLGKRLLSSLLLVFVSGSALLFAGVERIEKGNLLIEGIPQIPDRVIDRLVQYQNTRSANFQDWAASGEGMLISTRFGETNQFHFITHPGAARQQITFFQEPVGGAAMRPDPDKSGFLFTKDVGGAENYQIFYFNIEEGSYRMLTDGTSRNGAVAWANAGDRFAYYTTQRNGRDWDIYLNRVDRSRKPTALLETEGTWVPVDWSPDDRRLLVIHYISINESSYAILDTKTGGIEPFLPSDEKIAYGLALWSKDGKGIYFTSDEGSEFHRLKYYDLQTGQVTILTEHIPWNIEEFDLSPDGQLLAFVSNEGGISKLHLMRTSTGREIRGIKIPMGLAYDLSFDPKGSQLAFVLNTPQTPGDVYTMNPRTKKIERWTYSEVGGLDTQHFVVPKLIEYETFDQNGSERRKIPAFYFKPNLGGEEPFPVLILIHGGPEGQYRPAFSSTVQYFANEMGIAVLAPNVRGSAGYGKTYVKLDNGYNREDSVRDIGQLLDWVEKQPELDNKRIAVIGGSYGGYMVLASMIHFRDRLRAGVDIVGISNFVTFLEGTKPYRRDLRRVEYGDERDPEMRAFLQKISPTTNAHKITRPMFIAQGLNDPRVPVQESEQIVKEIRSNGGSAWYLLAKDEGHGFRKKRNRDYYYQAVVLFLEQHLLAASNQM